MSTKQLRIFHHLLIVFQSVHLIQLGLVIDCGPAGEEPHGTSCEVGWISSQFTMDLYDLRDTVLHSMVQYHYICSTFVSLVHYTHQRPLSANPEPLRGTP